MKFTTFVAAPSGEDIEAFQAWFTTEYFQRFIEAGVGLVSAVVRLSQPAPGQAPERRGDPGDPAQVAYHVLLESWFVTTEDFRRTVRIAEPLLRTRGAAFVSYRVTPMLEKDPRFAEAGSKGARPALTYVTPVSWRAGLSGAEARRHWDEPVSTALRVHASLTKYERNWVDEVVSWSEGASPVGGYADFSFRTLEDWDQFFPDDAARLEIAQDIANFIQSGSGIFLGDVAVAHG